MKMFLVTMGCLLAATILFVLGATAQNGFLMFTMCPGAIVALWLNGFAFASGSKSFARILAKLAGLQVVDSEQPKQRTNGNKPQPRQEYQ